MTQQDITHGLVEVDNTKLEETRETLKKCNTNKRISPRLHAKAEPKPDDPIGQAADKHVDCVLHHNVHLALSAHSTCLQQTETCRIDKLISSKNILSDCSCYTKKD